VGPSSADIRLRGEFEVKGTLVLNGRRAFFSEVEVERAHALVPPSRPEGSAKGKTGWEQALF